MDGSSAINIRWFVGVLAFLNGMIQLASYDSICYVEDCHAVRRALFACVLRCVCTVCMRVYVVEWPPTLKIQQVRLSGRSAVAGSTQQAVVCTRSTVVVILLFVVAVERTQQTSCELAGCEHIEILSARLQGSIYS